MARNIDFSKLNLVVIDMNVNSTPDMYVNLNNITFSKRVMEDLNFPAFVQYCVDPEQAVFAIRACKGNESRATPFSKPRAEQTKTLSTASKSLHNTIVHMIPNYNVNMRYEVVGFCDKEKGIVYYDLREAKGMLSRTRKEDEE